MLTMHPPDEEQVELSRDISESRRELEDEQTHTRRAFGREREQHSVLESLGLNEVEAVDYVLLLSREEEEARRAQLSAMEEENLFAGHFDEDIQTPVITPSNFCEGSSNGHSQATSPANDTGSRPISLQDESHFPSMHSSPVRRSVSSSPASMRSAWSTPLRSSRSSEGPSSPGILATSPVSRIPEPEMSLLSARFAEISTSESSPGRSSGAEDKDDDEDEDLRFALELSLAEARSRGEAV